VVLSAAAGMPHVDDGSVTAGISFLNHNGLRWRDFRASYGRDTTINNRFIRQMEMGVRGRIFIALAKVRGETGNP
jgi:transposase